jgi:hypothetical protein
MQEESGMLLEQLHGNAGREDLPARSGPDADRYANRYAHADCSTFDHAN